MSQDIIFECKDSVARLILNRPDKRNAFDDQMIQSMITHIRTAAADERVRVLILKANGAHFSAGGDLNWMKRMATYTDDENIQDAKALATLMSELYHFSKPTLALVQGSVYGGGVGLVACCDTAIGAKNVKFCLSEVKIGLIPAVIAPYVIQAMGLRLAKHYMLSADIFDASVGLNSGLLHQVQDDMDLSTCESQWIEQLCKNAPHALKQLKVQLSKHTHLPFDASMIDDCAQRIAKIRASAEGQEGLGAFLEKRKPNWTSQT